MRTTVTLDSDTEQLIRERMERRGVSFKQALNDLVRESQLGAPAAHIRRTQAVPLGTATTDLTHALRIDADLQDEEIIRKLRAGR